MRPPVSLMVLVLTAAACGRTKDMPERVDVHDTMPVMKAMRDMNAADSMLDTMPGGEMARGDSTSAMKLLQKKTRR